MKLRDRILRGFMRQGEKDNIASVSDFIGIRIGDFCLDMRQMRVNLADQRIFMVPRS